MADKKALYKAALDAGHELPSYDDITGAQLQELLDGTPKVEAKKASLATVHNLRKNPVSVAGETIKPGGKMDLTATHMGDERLMAKIKHGVKTGVYKLESN